MACCLPWHAPWSWRWNPQKAWAVAHAFGVHDRLWLQLLARRAPLEEVAPEYESLLAPYKTRFLQRQVSGVQIFDGDNGAARGGVVTFDDFNQERFDYLVVALGGVANLGAPYAFWARA